MKIFTQEAFANYTSCKNLYVYTIQYIITPNILICMWSMYTQYVHTPLQREDPQIRTTAQGLLVDTACGCLQCLQYLPRWFFKFLNVKYLPRNKRWHRTHLTDFFTSSMADSPLNPLVLPPLSKDNHICSLTEWRDWFLPQLAKIVKAVWFLKHLVDKTFMMRHVSFFILQQRAGNAAWGNTSVQYLVLPCGTGE